MKSTFSKSVRYEIFDCLAQVIDTAVNNLVKENGGGDRSDITLRELRSAHLIETWRKEVLKARGDGVFSSACFDYLRRHHASDDKPDKPPTLKDIFLQDDYSKIDYATTRIVHAVFRWMFAELVDELVDYNDSHANSAGTETLPGLEAITDREEPGFNVTKRALEWCDRRRTPTAGDGKRKKGNSSATGNKGDQEFSARLFEYLGTLAVSSLIESRGLTPQSIETPSDGCLFFQPYLTKKPGSTTVHQDPSASCAAGSSSRTSSRPGPGRTEGRAAASSSSSGGRTSSKGRRIQPTSRTSEGSSNRTSTR